MKKFFFIFASFIIATGISQIISGLNSTVYHEIIAIEHNRLIVFTLFIIYLGIFSILPFLIGAIILNFGISESKLKLLIYKFAVVIGLIDFSFVISSFCCTYPPLITHIVRLRFSSIRFSFSLSFLASNFLNGIIFAIGMKFITSKNYLLLYESIVLAIFLIWKRYFSQNPLVYETDFPFTLMIAQIIISEVGLFTLFLAWFLIQRKKSILQIIKDKKKNILER